MLGGVGILRHHREVAMTPISRQGSRALLVPDVGTILLAALNFRLTDQSGPIVTSSISGGAASDNRRQWNTAEHWPQLVTNTV